MLRIALYQPDIPQNTGTIMRLCTCLGLPLDIIEPCGFPLDDKKIRRAGMDYIDHLDWTRHPSWDDFKAYVAVQGGRILLMTTKSSVAAQNFTFKNGDILLFGRESAGVPDDVHAQADAHLRIPMRPVARSLNVAVSCAMVTAMAMQQLGGFDHVQP